MSKISGKGPIMIGANKVLHMASWSIDIDANMDTNVELDSDWEQADYGVLSYGGSASGLSASDDTTGQDMIESALLNKTKITDIKFYQNFTEVSAEKNVYWSPKAGEGGILISKCGLSKDGGSETTKVNFSFKGDGMIEKKVVVVA